MSKRKPKPHIPQSPGECTAEWFNTILCPQNSAEVIGVETEPVGEGLGFVGDLFRCSLHWKGDAADMPTSVVVKVPSSVHGNRAVGETIQAYEREIVVYRDLGEGLGIPMPRYVHSDLDPHRAPWLLDAVTWLLQKLPIGGVNWLIKKLLSLPDSAMRRYLLVIEDINDARPATQFDGGSLEDVVAALEVLARFHAANWMNTALVDNTPLVWSINRTPKIFQAIYGRNRQQFIDRFTDVVGLDFMDRMDDVQTRIPELLQELSSEPWTVLHGDYRLDNILFRPNGELVVLDYQALIHGRPGWDVAYFITTALEPEHREEEERLLRVYHQELLSCGVHDYSFEELVRDAHATMDVLAHRMVGAGDLLQTEIEGRDETLIANMTRRIAGWVER